MRLLTMVVPRIIGARVDYVDEWMANISRLKGVEPKPIKKSI